jgi:phosphoribosylanthranilate isomerase
MMKPPAIYVQRITNLSDARYCAGMGVNLLGFVVNPVDVDYVSPKLYQDMIGWISGPGRVAEWTGHSTMDADEIISNYKPDFLHVDWIHIGKNKLPDLPLLVEVAFRDLSLCLNHLQEQRIEIAYLVVTDIAREERYSSVPSSGYPVLLSIPEGLDSIAGILSMTGVQGLMLQGSRELAPGLKDYDHLSRILEALEG